MGSDSLFFIIIAICLIMSAYFSATETAFLSLNRIRMKNMADKGNKRAALVLELEEKYDNLLSTILIGNNIVNILSSSLATILFVKMLGDAKGASVSTIVTTVLVLIFGEISPKSIAKESPDKFALFSAPIIAVLVKILTPVNFVFAQWKKLLSHIFKSEEEPGITEEELLTIVDEYIKMERRDSYEDGHEDGLAEGKRLEQLHVVHNLFQKSIPAENCADLLNENTDFVNKIYSLCHAHPDWSDEDIYNALKEK